VISCLPIAFSYLRRCGEAGYDRRFHFVATRAADPAGERLVRDVAPRASLVLRNVALIGDLRASRQRIVASADQAVHPVSGPEQHDSASVRIRYLPPSSLTNCPVIARPVLQGRGGKIPCVGEVLTDVTHKGFDFADATATGLWPLVNPSPPILARGTGVSRSRWTCKCGTPSPITAAYTCSALATWHKARLARVHKRPTLRASASGNGLLGFCVDENAQLIRVFDIVWLE
jgi:hypothetical protein